MEYARLSYPKWPVLTCPALAGFGCPLTYFIETPETGEYRVVKTYGIGRILDGVDREAKTIYAEFRIES